MISFNQNVGPLLVGQNTSILDALRQLEATKHRLLICVDDEGRLVGVVGDGDIRRALIVGANVADTIANCVRRNPVKVNSQATQAEASVLMSERVHLLPVIDEQRRVVGYYSLQAVSDGPRNVRFNRTVVVGMGYVGVTLAVSLAATGIEVVGYDVRQPIVDMLTNCKAPFFEVGLQTHLESLVGGNLKFVTSLEAERADIYLISVGTPIDPLSKRPNLESVRTAALQVGARLERGNTVIMRSTLPIGCSRNVVLPALEQASGLKAGKDFYFAFAPERTIEGRALPELRSNPQIVGGLDSASADITRQLFSTLTHSVVDVGTLEAAEMCKLMDNCFRDHTFAFANQLAPLTERLGLDLNRLVEAVNFGYPRNRVPRPSPGVGGPCLSKDPYILASVFEQFGLDPALLLAARAVNEAGPGQVSDKVEALLGRAGKKLADSTVTLVGLAFKGEPQTSDLRDSTSLGVVKRMRAARELRAYDPVVDPAELTELGCRPMGLADAVRGSDAVVILNNHRSYENWNLTALLPTMNRPAVFIDTWHIFDPMEMKTVEGILYGGLGND